MKEIERKKMYDFILEDIRKDLQHRHKLAPWKPFIYTAGIGGMIAVLSLSWQLCILLALALGMMYFAYVRPKREEAVFELTEDDISISVDECVGVKYDMGTDGSRDSSYVYFRNAGMIELPETSWAPHSIRGTNRFSEGEKYCLVILRQPWPMHRYFYPASWWQWEDTPEEIDQ